MKQKLKFLSIAANKKLLYLVEIRDLAAYHFNMIYAVLIIDLAALFKSE